MKFKSMPYDIWIEAGNMYLSITEKLSLQEQPVEVVNMLFELLQYAYETQEAQRTELRLSNYYGTVTIEKDKTGECKIFLPDYDVDIDEMAGIPISRRLYRLLKTELRVKPRKKK